jgi:hypothetical protein
VKKALNGVILLCMLASIAVQYNDPDGILWALVYGFGAVMAFNALRGRYDIPLLIIGIIATGIGGFLLGPDQWEGWITNEVARETGGLWVTTFFLIVILAQVLLGAKPEEPDAEPVEVSDD